MKIKPFSACLLLGLLWLPFAHLPAQGTQPDFSAIDSRALRSPRALSTDLPALMAYLVADTNSELEKVRAIYVWITTHIDYDWKAAEQDKRINHFISDILERKVAVCFGYAQLFEKMCSLAGIQCALVNGYAKGTAVSEGVPEEPNHSWNAVRIDGRWYLLDATWGSSLRNKANNFVQIVNDDYFLVMPQKLVLTHLPGNPLWQLLANPVPMAVFQKTDTAVREHLSIPDSTYAYRDSLAMFQRFPPERRRLLEYERTYQFYPTAANGGQFGHALLDYAGILSDSLEKLSPDDERELIAQFHEQIIALCRSAKTLIKFYPWQAELFVNTLISQAVLQYNYPELAPANEAAGVLALLEEARDQLGSMEDSYFSSMAREQCARYIEIVGSR